MVSKNVPRGPARPQPGDEALPDLFEVRITVRREEFEELLQKYPLDLGCRPHVERNADGTGTLQAFVPAARIQELEAAGYKVEQGENVSAVGRERQAEVGTGDRYQGGQVIPRGLGRKSGGGRQ